VPDIPDFLHRRDCEAFEEGNTPEMFRAQQNAFDDAVGRLYSIPRRLSLLRGPPAGLQAEPPLSARSLTPPYPIADMGICFTAKATDENLTSENWEYILVRFSERLTYSAAIGGRKSNLGRFCDIGCV